MLGFFGCSSPQECPLPVRIPFHLETKRVEIFSGKSIILQSDLPIKRISIANPEIADFLLISPKQVYLTGKTAGSTNLTLWQNDHILAIYDLNVVYDITGLKQRMNQVLPDEKELQVLATNDSVTLAGKVTSAASLSQAVNLAEAYAPEGKVQNLVEVGGVHQVMLEVRVSEISRSLTRRLGINLFYNRGGEFGVSTLGGLADLVAPTKCRITYRPTWVADLAGRQCILSLQQQLGHLDRSHRCPERRRAGEGSGRTHTDYIER